jgi:hypothetical protein
MGRTLPALAARVPIRRTYTAPVSDDPDNAASAAKRVSMTKPVKSGRRADSAAAPTVAKATRPRQVQGAVAALGASALAALIAALSLFGQRDWLTSEQKKANAKTLARAVKDATAKAKDAGKSPADIAAAAAKARVDTQKKFPSLHHQVSQQQSGALIGTIIVVAAIAILAISVHRGRYWARWGVVAFWLLASFSGTVVGVGTVLSVGSSVPAAFKVPSFLAGLFLVIAVVLVNFRVSTEYFALTKPDRPAGAPQRRGLFAPRTPPPGGRPGRTPAARGGTAGAKGVLTSSAATRGEAYVERQRAKKRAAANQESVARGAELARSRAKASKSRRIER